MPLPPQPCGKSVSKCSTPVAKWLFIPCYAVRATFALDSGFLHDFLHDFTGNSDILLMKIISISVMIQFWTY